MRAASWNSRARRLKSSELFQISSLAFEVALVEGEKKRSSNIVAPSLRAAVRARNAPVAVGKWRIVVGGGFPPSRLGSPRAPRRARGRNLPDGAPPPAPDGRRRLARRIVQPARSASGRSARASAAGAVTSASFPADEGGVHE